MRYIIGESKSGFIQIKSAFMCDVDGEIWNGVHKVLHGCNIEEATIIYSYDKAKSVLSEIQNRTSNIDFEYASVIDQILDEGENFDKFDFVKKLKIYSLVATLVEDKK